jgi:hypothetical protein
LVSVLARPTDVVVEWRQSFRHGFIPLTAVSGTALTANATALANAQSAVGSAFPSSSFPLINTELLNLRNALEYVTAAGDYYYDAGASTLYYYPRSTDNMATAVAEVGAVDTLLTVSGSLGAKAIGIAIRGLIFEGSTWSGGTSPASVGYSEVQAGTTGPVGDYFGVSSTYAHQPSGVDISLSDGTTFAGCTFRRFAAAALAMPYGSKNATVIGCTFSDLGGVGVYDGDITVAAAHETDPRALNTGNVVTRCTFTDISATYYCSVPWLASFTAGSVFTRNTIARCGWSAVHIGWGWGARVASPASNQGACTVTYNRITATCVGMGNSTDGGSIYSNGARSAATLVDSNYTEPGNNVAFYSDNASTNGTWSNNVAGPDTANNATAYGGYVLRINQSQWPSTGNVFTTNYGPNAVGTAINGSTSLQTLSGNLIGTSGVTPFGALAAAIRKEAGR